MNVDYHGHWYVHGASILLEPPHLSSSGQDANGYPPFTEGCFRVLHSPPFRGCTLSWPSSVPRTWDRMWEGQRHILEMECCLCIGSLKHTSLPPCWCLKAEGPRGCDTGHGRHLLPVTTLGVTRVTIYSEQS